MNSTKPIEKADAMQDKKPIPTQEHFLNAIRAAKIPVTIFLTSGVKLQGISGEELYGLLSASLNKLAMYENYFSKSIYVSSVGGGNANSRYFTYQDLEKILRDNPGLRQSVGLCNKSSARHLFERSILSVMHYIFSKIDHDEADAFFDSLATGANLDKNSPILTLRNTALKWKENNKKVMNYEVMCFFIRAWNAYITDESLVFLRFNPSEAFPDPLNKKAKVTKRKRKK